MNSFIMKTFHKMKYMKKVMPIKKVIKYFVNSSSCECCINVSNVSWCRNEMRSYIYHKILRI